MLEKREMVDQIEVKPLTGHVQVRIRRSIMEDGVELSCDFLRYTLEPNSDLSNQPGCVAAQAKAAWAVFEPATAEEKRP